MTDFSFIRNDELRFVIERDFAELQRLNPEEQPKAVVVLAGAILEGLLTDALTVAGRWDFDSACQQGLAAMMGPAKARGIIRQDHLSSVVKNSRDLVHPGREVRRGIQLTKDDADLARAAVNVTIRDISLWYETPSGKAAVAQKLPTETVPPEKQRTFLHASGNSIDVRIDSAVGSTFMIVVTNNSDEAFDIAGAIVELEGASLGSIARPQHGIAWTLAPGEQRTVRWPDPCNVMTDLVYRRGRFEPLPYIVPIDIILDCILDDEQRQLKKRAMLQVDPVNKRGIQL